MTGVHFPVGRFFIVRCIAQACSRILNGQQIQRLKARYMPRLRDLSCLGEKNIGITYSKVGGIHPPVEVAERKKNILRVTCLNLEISMFNSTIF